MIVPGANCDARSGRVAGDARRTTRCAQSRQDRASEWSCGIGDCTLRSRMTSALYFHGFASSPASAKITALRPLLEPHGIELNTPDLNVPSFEKLDFDAMVGHALPPRAATPPRAMVGSSLGALVALAVAQRGVRRAARADRPRPRRRAPLEDEDPRRRSGHDVQLRAQRRRADPPRVLRADDAVARR